MAAWYDRLVCIPFLLTRAEGTRQTDLAEEIIAKELGSVVAKCAKLWSESEERRTGKFIHTSEMERLRLAMTTEDEFPLLAHVMYAESGGGMYMDDFRNLMSVELGIERYEIPLREFREYMTVARSRCPEAFAGAYQKKVGGRPVKYFPFATLSEEMRAELSLL